MFNTNKRGMALNLKSPEGKKIMYQLIERADVFLTNFRPKAITNLGLDYETL